jgi:hypothetical protein
MLKICINVRSVCKSYVHIGIASAKKSIKKGAKGAY